MATSPTRKTPAKRTSPGKAPTARVPAGKAQVVVRAARQEDRLALLRLYCALWPDEPRREHDTQLRGLLSGRPPSTLPLTLFVATAGDSAVGFVEVGLRSHANGCDPRRPIGFIEGWYVTVPWRRRGVGGRLLAAAEAWSRAHGCREMASDTWANHRLSIAAHQALGYAVEGRYVNFHKVLRTRGVKSDG